MENEYQKFDDTQSEEEWDVETDGLAEDIDLDELVARARENE